MTGTPAAAAVAAVALFASVAGVSATWRASARIRRPPAGGFDDLLVAGAAWLLVLCLTWLTLLVAVAIADAWSAERFGLLRHMGCPPRLRSLLLALVGAALMLHLPAAAVAAPPTSWPEPAPGASPATWHEGSHNAAHMAAGGTTAGAAHSVPAPGRAVGRAAGPAAEPAADPARNPAPGRGSVVVRNGDSLWAIAAADLDRRPASQAVAGASDALIAQRVTALHAHNRSRIGADPDLIVPGQRLRLPWATATATAPTGSSSQPSPPPQQSQQNEPKENR